MPFPRFDRSRLRLLPLAERVHDMTIADVLPVRSSPVSEEIPHLSDVADRVRASRAAGRPVIWLMGAHVIKQGLSRFVIALM